MAVGCWLVTSTVFSLEFNFPKITNQLRCGLLYSPRILTFEDILTNILTIMKELLLFTVAFFLFAQNSFSQFKFDEETSSFIADTLILKEGLTKQEIYKRAKEWTFRTLWVSGNELAFSDETSDRIFTKGVLKLDDVVKNRYWSGGVMYANRLVSFRMALFFKDGKAKVITENIVIQHEIISSTVNKTETYNLEKLYEFQEELNAIEKPKKLTKDRLNNINVIIADAERALSLLFVQLDKSLNHKIMSEREDW